MNLSTLQILAAGMLILLGIGFYGLLASRNMIKIIVAQQVLAKAAMLGLIVAGNISGKIHLSESLATTVIVVDTLIAVLGLAFAIQIRRHVGTLDVRALSRLRE